MERLSALSFCLIEMAFVVGCGPYIRGANIATATIPLTPQQMALAQNGFGGNGAPIPATYSTPMCWGQPDCYTSTADYPSGTPTSTNTSAPYTIGAYYDVNDAMKLKFFLTDRANNRILIFNSIPTSATTPADIVVGQPSFTTGGIDFNNGGTVTAQGFNTNSHVTVCPNGLMFVADRSNNRVLGYNRVPTTSGVSADFVIGQTTMGGGGAGTASNQMNAPSAVHCINNMLFIVEKGNNRIQVFNPIPTTSNPSASFTIGAPDVNSGGTNNCAASSMSQPYEAASDGTSLYVADANNNRVVIYTPIPTANGAQATAVIGQPSLGVGEAAGAGNCQVNQGAGNPSAYTLHWPESLTVNGNWLAISDDNNNRILFYTLPISTTTPPAALYQFGQLDMNSVQTAAATPTQITQNRGIIFAGSAMWAPDFIYNRLMVFQLPFTP